MFCVQVGEEFFKHVFRSVRGSGVKFPGAYSAKEPLQRALERPLSEALRTRESARAG